MFAKLTHEELDRLPNLLISVEIYVLHHSVSKVSLSHVSPGVFPSIS